MRVQLCLLLSGSAVLLFVLPRAAASDPDVDSDHIGLVKSTLTSHQPLAVYDVKPDHLWNRMFSAFYIRPRHLPAADGQPATVRYEGGDVIEFLAWGGTRYWSSEQVFDRVNPLLDEFLQKHGAALISDPLKRAVFQHDLWAVHDHLTDLNIRRTGDVETRARRSVLCGKLAKCMQQLALSADELKQLPATYEAAVKSGDFAAEHHFNPDVNYLPHGLLNSPDEWVEMDFYYPDMHEDIMDRFVSLHARSLQGRSHYRIFYRFPEGRQQLNTFLQDFESGGFDWKHAAQFGFIRVRRDAPQIPVGTEVLLLQQMMLMNDRLQPVPTNIVESVQFRAYANIDGAAEPETNTGVGMNILDYRLKRELLFDGVKSGGLHREPEGERQYRVAIDGDSPKAPDWGFDDKAVLFQQCANCHMSPKLDRLGSLSIPSLTHSGGFNAGAQMGVSRPLSEDETGVRGKRVARYKSRHETFRRLLEALGQ